MDLSYNTINQEMVDLIIPNIKKLTKINLAHNKIGKRGCEIFAELFSSEKKDKDDYEECCLEDINL